jgi:DNA-binding response OmpR family regulator
MPLVMMQIVLIVPLGGLTYLECPKHMHTILVVDDDPALLKLVSANLSDTYDVVGTEDPEQALGLALRHKPAAILLDLMMPKYSGFELCQCLHSLSYTSRTPLFVVTGHSAEKYETHCLNLGASRFIEKPVDFENLKAALASELQKEKPERRAHVRLPLRIVITLKGADARGGSFEETTLTENVSSGGFLSACTRNLRPQALVDVFVGGGTERLAGQARVMRKESPLTPWQRYAFHFIRTTDEWLVHPEAS